jgi:hypothetical protein
VQRAVRFGAVSSNKSSRADAGEASKSSGSSGTGYIVVRQSQARSNQLQQEARVAVKSMQQQEQQQQPVHSSCASAQR